MLNSKITFVVGAGASSEAELPTGRELTATIAKMIDIKFDDFGAQPSGDRVIAQALREHVRGEDGGNGDIYSYQQAGWFIKDAMPQVSSIDSFIDAHQGNEKVKLCGKLAIVRSILDAEQNSLLFFDDRNRDTKLDFNRLEETWYSNFLRMLVEGCTRENCRNIFINVSFIIFNYDRCVEHFLFNAVQNYYGIEQDEAATIMRGLRIIHPYGSVGELPWQADTNSIRFGGANRPRELLSQAGKIKTYSERIGDMGALTNLHRLLKDAEAIVFLGFAFHDDNMTLMRSGTLKRLRRVFATAIDISDSDRGVIEVQIKDLFGKHEDTIPIQLRSSLHCHQIFDEYSRTLTQ